MEVKAHFLTLLEHQQQPTNLENEKSKMKEDELGQLLVEVRLLDISSVTIVYYTEVGFNHSWLDTYISSSHK